MKILLTALLSIVSTISFSQQIAAKDSLHEAINNLNWESFAIETTGWKVTCVLNDNAQKITSMKDPDKYEKLINAISDSSKTAVIHIILSKCVNARTIIEDGSKNIGPKRVPVFSYNGLKWAEYRNKKWIVDDGMNTIKKYWTDVLITKGPCKVYDEYFSFINDAGPQSENTSSFLGLNINKKIDWLYFIPCPDSVKRIKLIAGLDDKSKIITLHWLLTKNYEDISKVKSWKKKLKNEGTRYKMNHLRWTKTKDGKVLLTEKEIDNIKHYWNKR